MSPTELGILKRIECGPPSRFEKMCRLRNVWVHCLEGKVPNGSDEMDVNVFLEGSLANVPIRAEAWPFGGEGDEQVASILLGNEDGPRNFFPEHIGVRTCPWRYHEEDAPPCEISGEVAHITSRGCVNVSPSGSGHGRNGKK
ncbi:hypothetical protein V6N13_104961 [Hibiscus sabdariffa]|uniref:Uncharacterized protein n=2 Tax=Hibiscus sabdariffa TaxID=183260 RepID=A0ABR2SIW7_9ROSI